MDRKNFVKLAVDCYKGNVQNYSSEDANTVLRKALIEMNNGKTHLDYRDIRDGKCPGLFSLIEEILSVTAVEGLQSSDFFNALVDYRNVAEGDKNVFVVEDRNVFVVHDAADGTQGTRRQRLSGRSEMAVPTGLKMVRIYEELNRVLSGRIDFNEMINKVSKAFSDKMLEDVFTLWNGATADQMGGATYFPAAGSFSEDALIDLISHVEAAAGAPATIVGTKKALRAIKESLTSDAAKEEMHENGYIGKFNGTPVVAIPQRHKVGSTEFVMSDKVLTILAGDDKPIKFVYEGDPIILMGDPMQNADLTQEYLYGIKYGTALVLAGGNAGIGRYTLA